MPEEMPEEPVTLADKIVLDWNRYAVSDIVSEHLLTDTAAFSAMQDRIFGGLILRLQRDVLTDRLAEEEYQAALNVPASPFQHWKHKHQGAWWLRWVVRRRPVRYDSRIATVKVERWQTYPEARLPRERFGRAVIFENVTGPIWRSPS